jgi:hypothetical protein
MIPADPLKHRVLEAVHRNPVPARRARRLPAVALAALAAGAMLAAYAAMHAVGALAEPGQAARGLRAVSSGLAIVLGLGTATAGRPPGSGGALVAGAVALAVAATLLALPSRRSMLSPARGLLLGVAVGVPVLVGAWLVLWHATYADPFVRTGWRCFALTALTAPWPFLALAYAGRRMEPRHPGTAGAALGAVGGAWAAVMVELWCPLASQQHVLLGHVLPLFVLALAGAAVGVRAFRLRRL